jgi:3-oxoacyl-[acyl-carrier-protein] synthase-3
MDQSITRDDIDLFVFHQANLRINEYVANQMGIPPEKCANNIDRYGNTTAATIPILLAEAERDGRLKRGMKVVAVAFGSGFTWGAAIIDW